MQTQTLLTPSQYLKAAYLNSAKANPRFTLRAFAKKLGLSPGGLSQILAQKKKLSFDRAYIISQKLGLSSEEREYFLLLAQKDLAGISPLAAEIDAKLKARYGHQSTNLALEQFQLISEWYGPALLEMITHFASNWSVFKMAKHLHITHAEAQSAIDHLLKLQLIIKKNETSYERYERNTQRLLVDSQIPHAAIRSYYTGVLGQAKNSIETQTPSQKVTGTEVFAFDIDQIQEVKNLTESYLNQLNALALKGKERDQVYQAFVNVFCLGEPGRATKTRKSILNIKTKTLNNTNGEKNVEV